MIELGVPKKVIMTELPKEILTETIPGRVYNIQATTKGYIRDVNELYNTLSTELEEKYRTKLLYLNEDNGIVNMQVEAMAASSWTAIIAYIPSVFTVFGLILISIAVFGVLNSIPSWAWGLLAVGGVLIISGPLVSKALRRS